MHFRIGKVRRARTTRGLSGTITGMNQRGVGWIGRAPAVAASVRASSKLRAFGVARAASLRPARPGRLRHLSSWAAEYAALPLPAPWAAASAALAISGLLYSATVTSSWLTAGLVLVCQLVLVASWIGAMKSRSPRGLAVASGIVAVLADVAALSSLELSLERIAVVGAGSFLAVVFVQFCMRDRRQVSFALGEAMQLQLALLGLATLVVLAADPIGAVAGGAAAAAAGISIVVAQLGDAITRKPMVHPLVPRGWLGIVTGVGAGCAVGAVLFAASGITLAAGISLPALGATLGGVVALVATLVDVASGYELVGRAVAATPTLAPGTSRRRRQERGLRFANLPTLTAVAVAVRGPLLAIAFGVATGYVVISLLPI
ncbi:MAG: hypothetical protein DLM55_11515 [Acidimicrobiales bacterium]|nr:MAG: hypothetical protein DLM55_11515 [Acidimicrobiales bacterium]